MALAPIGIKKPALLIVIMSLILAGGFGAFYLGHKFIRQFRPKPLLMAGQDHSVSPMPDADKAPNPLEQAIRDARTSLSERSAQPAPTGINREAYLKMIQSIIGYFGPHQIKSGEIIDPYAHREIQYATPSYALAAAVLVASGKQPDLLDSASRALDKSLLELAEHRAADHVGDFFIYPAMVAYRTLRDRVDPAVRERWDGYLRKIDPDLAYSDRIGPGQPDVMNWNSNAILGEYLRARYGFTDQAFVSRYMDAQRPRFTPEGLYRDPDFPLVYDAAARFNFSMLLAEGYQGPHRPALETLLRRGAWASLLMQSPAGDFPIGGRSSGHVWNDALQCASFELWARRAAAGGDALEAGAFKRAAHLSFLSLARWVRPSGELWIVKNRADPAARFGYEDYSFHSQYNLLAAAYLALAWSFSDDAITEQAAPAETGNFIVDLPQFHKLFANFEGHYLELDTGADTTHNGTGLLRSDGPDPDRPPLGEGGEAMGVGWRQGDKIWTLAQFPADKVKPQLLVHKLDKDGLHFSIRYVLSGTGVKQVIETYDLTRDRVTVHSVADGPIDQLLVRFPAYRTDGRNRMRIDASENAVEVSGLGQTRIFRILSPAGKLVQLPRLVHDRSGTYALFQATTDKHDIRYELTQQ